MPEKPQKPKLRINENLIEETAESLFNDYSTDWAGDNDSRLWEELADNEADSWRERATELLTPAYEQGKREGAKAERERILDYLGGKLDGMTSGEFIQIPNMRDWLKAELEGR